MIESILVRPDEWTFRLVPRGKHPAVCIEAIDLGSQFVERVNAFERKVAIVWEMPAERARYRNADGELIDRPHRLSKWYTLAFDAKSPLRRDLERVRGRGFSAEELRGGFELAGILGMVALLEIAHVTKADKTFARILRMDRLPAGMPAPMPESPLHAFGIDQADRDSDGLLCLPDWMPGWAKENLMRAEEFEGVRS